MRHAANDDFRQARPIEAGTYLVRLADAPDGEMVAAESFEAAVVGYLENAAPCDGELTVLVSDTETGIELAFDIHLAEA